MSLIIWDELLMAHRAVWECINELCQNLKHNQQPFGGIPFVGLGDFQQVAPVIPGTGPTATLHALVKRSSLWATIKICHLITPV